MNDPITLTLRRTRTGDTGTFGKLSVLGKEYVTGELPDRNNEGDFSNIPAGTYELKWTYSPHFKRYTYEIMNVPNREGVRVHVANWMGDSRKGFKCELEGCTALGRTGPLDISGQEGIGGSQSAVDEFEALMAKRDGRITITDEYLEAGAPAPAEEA